MNENEKEVMTEAMENIECAVTDVTDVTPVVESSSGWKTVLGVGAATAGVIFGVPKVAQKIYDHRCKKQDLDTPEREKFYQFWRKKAKKVREPRMI